jgi:histone deacetylase complex regulatory component SIN3
MDSSILKAEQVAITQVRDFRDSAVNQHERRSNKTSIAYLLPSAFPYFYPFTEQITSRTALGCLQKYTFKLSVVMVPNLLEATNEYWRKLNELESAYQRGEVSLEEVNARVATLMAELGQERRASVRFLLDNVGRVWQGQREMIVGLGLAGALTYAWMVIS